MVVDYLSVAFWLVSSCVVVILSHLVDDAFRVFDKDYSKLMIREEKVSFKKFKSIEDQKSFIRGRADLGRDITINVFGVMLFVALFVWIALPLFNDFRESILFVVLIAGAYSFLKSLVFSSKYLWKTTIDSTINLSYTGIFLLFLKVIHPMNGLLLLLLSLLALISFERIGGRLKWW